MRCPRPRGAVRTSVGETLNNGGSCELGHSVSPPSLTAEQYDSAVRRLTEDGVLPADGLDYEICFGSPGNLKVSQVWDSQEQLDAFGARLMPILAELGIEPGQPEVLEVHNIIKR